jgi:hypothetical protein
MATQRQGQPGASRKISFNVSEQYDIQDVVGEGAYGVVWYVSPELERLAADIFIVLQSTNLPAKR